MYLEGGIGAGLLGLILAGYKIMSNRVDLKVDREWCEKLEHITCVRMTKGDEKFEKIIEVLTQQAVVSGQMDERIKNIDEKINRLLENG